MQPTWERRLQICICSVQTTARYTFDSSKHELEIFQAWMLQMMLLHKGKQIKTLKFIYDLALRSWLMDTFRTTMLKLVSDMEIPSITGADPRGGPGVGTPLKRKERRKKERKKIWLKNKFGIVESKLVTPPLDKKLDPALK